jgi:GMP synthase-like glutamine amidotransferase
MNNGVTNEATRCFKRLFDAFVTRVRDANPQLKVDFRHVQPRNLGEVPREDADLVLSSGGPGSPFDGYDEQWCTDYRKFLDHVVEKNLKSPLTAPSVFVVCHSYEITVNHFAVARMAKRESLKFGVFPAYVTAAGQQHSVFDGFGERLFTWEHRTYEAIDLNEKRLKELGGKLLATESREGRADKGNGLMGFEFAPGVCGTQFHPEADRPGVIAWINRPEHSSAFKDKYGHSLYDRMMKTLSDPTRLGRTFGLLIPGWLTRRFNEIAATKGLAPISLPEQDMRAFEEDLVVDRTLPVTPTARSA